MQRLLDFAKGLAGLSLTLALLLGLPIALALAVGLPVPTRWPGIETILRHMSDGDIPDSFILKLLASIAWVAWAQLAAATVIEYVNIVSGKAVSRTLTFPSVRMFAVKLATWTTLLISAVGPARPALAGPLTPISAVFDEVDYDASPGPDRPAQISVSDQPVVDGPTASSAKYVAQRGDSWWTIAESLLGDGMRWNEIRTLNLGSRMADGTSISATTDSVQSGWTLAVPADAELPAETVAASVETLSQVAAKEEVTVKEGDHFWAIADHALTQAWGRSPADAELTPYWLELVKLNKDRLLPPEDPNLIYPEQRFVLPDLPPSPDQAPDLNGSEVLRANDLTVPTSLPELSDPAPNDPIETQVEASQGVSAPGASAPVSPAPQSAASPSAQADGATALDTAMDEAKSIGIVAGGAALLGGMLLFTLRRLRRIQAARRRPGTEIDPPETEASAYERRIRSISVDGEDVRYLAAVNRYLSHKLENADTPIPHILAARAGQFGLELLLDEPCEPVVGFFTSKDDKKGWTLSPDLDARMMEGSVGDDAHPFAPALCVVGSTTAGDLLVDLEQMGSISIEGGSDEVVGFQRGLIAGLCAAPWTTECSIVSIGIDGLSNDELSRVLVPEDPVAWADATATKMRHIASSLDRSPYEERVAHGSVYHPTVVIIGPSADLAGVAQHLGPVADLAYSPLAIVSAHPLVSEHRIAIADKNATIEPLGISFTPLTLAAAELHAVDHLIANASDTTASPPAEVWADEIKSAESPPSEAGTSSNGQVHQASVDLTVEDVDSDGKEPSAETVVRIEEIMKPRPVEIRILGRKPVVEGLEDTPSPKLEAIIVYLAFHGDVVSQRFRDEFWTSSTGRSAADNAIMRVRALLGDNADGKPRLDSARNTGTYSVSDEVGMDWHRVEELVAAAKGTSRADEAAYLHAACELIDGHIAADASPSSYAWLLREPTIYTLIETTLVDAAHRCGELALGAGDCDMARWAARKGLTIVEGQESLYRDANEGGSRGR